MSNIENQIVSMQFDNKQFESGVATSLGTIDKLNSSLQFKNGVNGISEINRAASGLNLNPISAGIQGLNKAWIGMTTIAVTALANITNKAVDAGLRFAKSFTLDPIKAGFENYETKINAVQTILSNTADAGTTLKDVTKTLGELNTYANKTVYNFSEMAKNIGTFTAAGVDLKTSTESIKGIANLAALSGSTSAQASSAMYQLSQAIAAGQVHLQDWNSVVNAGIGGAAFQKNLIQAGLATGTLDKSQVHLGKTMADTTINGVAFRQSLTPPPGGTSWLTSGVLTKSLGTFTGDMSKAQLVAEGFTKAQAASIAAQGKRAVNAATQIKTFTQLFQALKEEVGTAYASVFEALFGNINQAKKFLSPLHTFIENALTQPIYAVADALKSWRKAGGFEDLIAIFKNLGTIVGNLLYPFKLLFGVLLPSSKDAGKGLEGFTATLAAVTGWLAKATSVTHKFGNVLAPVKKLFGILSAAAHSFLSALKPLLPILNQFGNYVKGLFNQGASIAGSLIDGWVAGLDPAALQKAAVDLANSWITWIKDALGIHSPAATMVPVGLNIVQGIVEGLQKGASFLLHGVQQLFIGLGQAFKWAVQNIKFDDVMSVLNTALNLGILVVFKRFVDAFSGTMKSFQTIMGQGGEVLDQMRDNLKTMQNQVRAKIIRDIAISVALLAASALLLSTVDGDKLKKSLAAIGGLMISLVASMKILTGGGKKTLDGKQVAKQSGQILALGAAMIEFSTAILILTGAVALMGQLDPKTMQRGLEGVGAVVLGVVAATAILSKTGGGATILATATALLILSAALTAFSGVMVLYSNIDFGTIADGGGKAALVIVAVGLAMRSFGKGAIAGSIGMVIAAGALEILADALVKLSAIGTGDMIKSVVAISIILGELAASSEALNPASAVSLLIMSAALVVLADALKILGKMSLWELAKALGAITLAIVILSVTSAALSELSPLVAALGTALLLLGGAIFLAGAGVFLFASAMGILAVVGPAAFQALADGIDTLLQQLPKIGEAVGGFFVSIITGIAKAAGPLVKALGKLIGILIDELIKLIPKGQRLFQRFINAVLDVIVHSYGHAAKVIIQFVLVLLKRLDDAVPKFIDRGSKLIISIIKGLGKNGVKIANATGKAILDFLKGLDKAITKYEPRIIAEGVIIAGDLVKGLVQGIHDGFSAVGQAASDLAHHALDTLKNPKNWHINSPSRTARKLAKGFGEGVAMGIQDGHHDVEKQAGEMAQKALDAIKMPFGKSRSMADGLIDLKPKITPVLDLTQLERDATKISGKMGSHSIKTEVSRHQARNIAADHAARHGSGSGETGGNSYEFVQNIYSPKPVNHVKAYRGTKSQIALLKEVQNR